MSKNHRDYQSEETRQKISESLMGHEVTEETRKRISEGNTGKKRTSEMRKAQSERMKGIEPKAASEGARLWREKNGSYWKGKKMSEEARAKIKLFQQKRGTGVIAHYPDGSTRTFSTMLDAGKETGILAGSIYNNLKHSSENYKTKTGFWFERIEKESN